MNFRKRSRPWSLRAVKRIHPVSSPMRHSAILVFWFCGPRKVGFRGFLLRTVVEFTTFTISVCPYVPGFRASTLTNTGFRSPGLFPATAPPSDCGVVESDTVAIGGDWNDYGDEEDLQRVWGVFIIRFWVGVKWETLEETKLSNGNFISCFRTSESTLPALYFRDGPVILIGPWAHNLLGGLLTFSSLWKSNNL